jgi:hypothetical protein
LDFNGFHEISSFSSLQLGDFCRRPGHWPASAQPDCYDAKEFPEAKQAFERRIEAHLRILGFFFGFDV